jgi:signal transduction histidine kinase
MRSLLAHHKDLLVTSMAEVAVLDEKARTLEQTNRMQSEFVANMTHELRSPLNTILGVVRIMMGDAEMPGGHLRHLGLVAERGQELLSIINNLLDLSKIEAGAMTPIFEEVELRSLFKDLLHSAEPLGGTKPMRLEARLDGLTPTFRTDPVFVRRIVSNLLSNAVKFTDAGAVALAAEGDQGAIVIRVSDSGIGIRSEDVERLFRKFTQLEATKTKRHAGTGLGLAIVKRLVDELNGSVSVETHQGSGTTFIVRHKPDLVLLDVNMPFLSGDELFKLFGDHPSLKGIPVAYFSSNDEASLRLMVVHTGAAGYTSKSEMGADFAGKVARILDRVERKG